MEMKELALQLGFNNILISNYNNDVYKDNITVIINDGLVLHLLGKTVAFIPLTKDYINKGVDMKSVNRILNTIKEQLNKKNIKL